MQAAHGPVLQVEIKRDSNWFDFARTARCDMWINLMTIISKVLFQTLFLIFTGKQSTCVPLSSNHIFQKQ